MATKIEWVARPGTTPETWNLIGGCTKKSPGCANCYAIRQSWMKMHHPNPKVCELYKGTVHKVNSKLEWTGRINLASSERLEKPLGWRKPRTVFVCSMGDLFHEGVPDEFINDVFNIMANLAPQHTYMVLTKRPRRMRQFVQDTRWTDRGLLEGQTRNIWLGVTAENQATADERIPLLLQTPAAVRFVSCEPLLESINFDSPCLYHHSLDFVNTAEIMREYGEDFWVIVGGESGPGARPMHPDWVRGLRDQCQAAGVPFFFKQWGGWVPNEDGCGGGFHFNSKHICLNLAGERFDGWMESHGEQIAIVAKANKKAAGRLLDEREWNEWPNK